ncbi:putative immunity protein [Paenibacillus xylanivorans]|uniref:Imm-5-like domain-containing protein n=1 Tax=Paenibacillus xylanivorans TaxID=1705561 RepID=A0A0M9BR23_9BACL|nr:hypothetical protein [Paenibacillus xylanivorans]KOY16606.1 hypothetical protein AMS66_10945 [Paenibacillus xylanivorans]
MATSVFKDTSVAKDIENLSRQLDHRTLARWAAVCAEHVLSLFEEKFPDDPRARQVIEAGLGWERGEITVVDARKSAFSAHVAARNSGSQAVAAASRAAGHAAATAHVKQHAVHAATYAAKAVFYSCALEDQAHRVSEEREWQYRYLSGGCI